jgi:hypothetical protein
MNTTTRQLRTSTMITFHKSAKTVWWLLKIIIPISLLVSFLQYWGVIILIARILSPAFGIIGLHGESAIVFISSIFLPLYGPIAIIGTLPISMREITILAIMCLISHNLFVETAVQKKTGSSALTLFLLRLCMSTIAAATLNLLLPAHIGSTHIIQKSQEFSNITDMLNTWLNNTTNLALKVSLIVTGLMLLQNILKEFKILDIISKTLAPLMSLLGLPADSSFLWFVAQTLGLGYGSAIMLQEIENNGITPKSANLLNYHIAINHSLLEDTLLFVAIGVPACWIIIPRIILAVIVVWCLKAVLTIRKNKNLNEAFAGTENNH